MQDVRCMVLYGSEIWTLLQENMNRLQAFDMLIWVRMMKASWEVYSTNEDILCMVQAERSVVGTIKLIQISWIGHKL